MKKPRAIGTMPGKASNLAEYGTWLDDLKKRVRTARQRAVLKVNLELIGLYWDIGHEILLRQERFGWGAKVIPRLSKDLLAEFPDMKGFSRTNLKYMRMFAMAWTKSQIGQAPLDQLPWYHQIALLERVETRADWLNSFPFRSLTT